jgi:hypothetical protein
MALASHENCEGEEVMRMYLTTPLEKLVTHIVARDIAAGVELARTLGFQMPKDFDIGVKFIHERNGRFRIRMRLDNATNDSIVDLPDLNGRRADLKRIDEMWKRAWERIHSDALTVAQVWIDKNKAKTDPDVSLTLLEALKHDDKLMDAWITSCRERAKYFKYTPHLP